MSNDTNEIIAENKRRLAAHANYDPLVGTMYCDTIHRVPIPIDDAAIIDMNIPAEMESEAFIQLLRKEGTLGKACRKMYGETSDKKCIA